MSHEEVYKHTDSVVPCVALFGVAVGEWSRVTDITDENFREIIPRTVSKG